MFKFIFTLFKSNRVKGKRSQLKDRLNGCINFKRVEEEQ